MNQTLKIRITSILFSCIALVALAAWPGPVRSSDDKIAPWVLEHTAHGAQAEFLVILSEQADLSGAQALPTKLEKGRYVREALWKVARSTQAPLVNWLAAHGVEHRPYYIVNVIWVKGNRDLAVALAARQDVARLEGNPSISSFPGLAKVPDPPRESSPYATSLALSVEANIAYVRAPEVWATGFTGQGIVIGGQDTGYDWTHPALKPHYRGWDGTTAHHDYNWHDSIHTGGGVCGADSPQPCDDNSHGTHTMGTAVGDDGPGQQIGMAPGATWIGCRNMDQGYGTPATYLECFEFFLAPYPVNGSSAQGDPAWAPDVTVNSWTCPSSEGCAWDTLQVAVEAQRAAGIMTVVSAGNSGPGCSTLQDPPATYAAAYTVGALDTGTDRIASLSSRGPVSIDGSYRRKPDLAAPGTGIRSSIPGGGYGTKTGTSMAGPHVAGAVALLWSARPALKNQITATEQALNDSAVHIDSTECSNNGWPNNTYGYGRLDAKAAVDMGTCISPVTGVDLAWTPRPALAGQTVTFTAIVTGGLEPLSYVWNLAGSLLLPGRPVMTYTFATAGAYTLTLQVSDGCSAMSIARPVEISARRFVYLPLVLKREDAWPLADRVVRVTFGPDDLAWLAARLDIWEIDHQAGYLLALVTPAEHDELIARGYPVQLDMDKTQLLHRPPAAPLQLPQGPARQTAGIPGFPCYRTVEETEATLQSLVTAYPTLAELVDIGDSWRKTAGSQPGYDLWELVISNKNVPGPKPGLFLMAEVHAREYATTELATRFAEYLLQHYGDDPDVTWMVDWHAIHILPLSNPDGRKIAEQGHLQRKNVNDSNGGACSNPPTAYSHYGIDINRNSSFKWGAASIYPCEQTYQGPQAVSEPETHAIQQRVLALYPDQRGPGDSDAAPDDASGVFITLHSYSRYVLFPWSWSTGPSPNDPQLQTLGNKFGYFNRYRVCQAGAPGCFYPASGTTDDWAYGELGLAAYTFEVGTDFFQDCGSFESTIYPHNLQALLYAARVARAPYRLPSGPDVLTPVVTPTMGPTGTLVSVPITLTAVADNTRYFGQDGGGEPVQAIAAAEYTLDAPPWVSGAITAPMQAGDGSFDSSVEGLMAVIQASLAPGRHTLYIRAKDADGEWGPVSAVATTLFFAQHVYLPLASR